MNPGENLFMHIDIASLVKDTVRLLEPSADVILFGSRARQDSGRESDWDFLVLVDGEVDVARCDRIRRALYEIEWESGEVICSIVKSRRIWEDPLYKSLPLYKAVEKRGLSCEGVPGEHMRISVLQVTGSV